MLRVLGDTGDLPPSILLLDVWVIYHACEC